MSGPRLSRPGNSRRPELTQTNLVDVFLFRADSQQQLLHFRELPNPSDQAGVLRTQVNDTWFGSSGQNWTVKNVSYPFYWVIIRSDKTLDGNQVPQPIFSAVQTTVLDSVASSSAAAASSSSALAASLSSLSAQSTLTASPVSSTSSTPGGNVQPASSESSFPRWAIAVIVVLGFLAIVATCILTFFIIRRVRRRRERDSSSRNSMGSASPMINRDGEMVQRYDEPASPLLPPPSIAAAAGAGAAAGAAHSSPAGATSTTHDGASTISDSGGPFSGADAAIMADAFRKMLRKPDFAGRPVEEGESPEQAEGGNPAVENPGSAVLSRELAEEGRDIRSVSSSRGVKVESVHHSEAGDPR
ncbi:hypothetical protein NLJ89_g11445 [Agrocybe chaxingu]|uniref:Uncharacterized protein n=1 Tax=Agrocybe chaxingu TaxID=84603 RepID=A0A9W8JW98_9AGAR|nr:hypothetical protein NLJ89_g11445 [Agrocybe chaxingu]